MKEYFSHDYNARNDQKLVALFMSKGLQGIGLYWCIIEMLYESNGYIMHSECERIAFELRTECNTIKSVISDTNLFKSDKKYFWSESVLKRLSLRNEKSEKAKASALVRWGNANAMRTHTERNAIKEKKIKVNKSKSNIEAFSKPTFEEVKEYCLERKNTVDAQKWFDYYTANGFKVGKNQMKDWQAAVRTWENNNKSQPLGHLVQAAKKDSDY